MQRVLPPTKRDFGFQRKFDQLGSVCISRKTKSSCRQRSITLVAIFVRHESVLRRKVRRRGTHLVSILLGKTVYYIFPDANTVHMFHYQNPISTSFPHPWDFEACIGAEPLQASERAHTCCLARIIAFVRQFLFHDLSHISLIHRQLRPFAVQNNEGWNTVSVLSRNSPRGSSRPAVRSMRM